MFLVDSAYAMCCISFAFIFIMHHKDGIACTLIQQRRKGHESLECKRRGELACKINFKQLEGKKKEIILQTLIL